MCLANKACYNGEFGVTYLAGCSDPDYNDSSCPDKQSFKDTPWTGLVLCNNTNQWLQCRQSEKPKVLTSPDPCSCPEPASRTIAFLDATKLADIGQLPATSGGSVLWQSGFIPTASEETPTSTPSTTRPSSSAVPTAPSSSSSASASPFSTSSALPTSNPPGMTAAAKAGIGVGASLGALLILGALLLLFLRRREHRRESHMFDCSPREVESKGKSDAMDMPGFAVTPVTPVTPALSELDPGAVRRWSELQGDYTPNPTLSGHFLQESTPRRTDGTHGRRIAQYAKHVAELPG
ncbi:hypothetical protein QBC33DRAFT_173434 [Phialemonium atrogriseum]|uniref:Uncharacterized protein n=1 Tax=Phialemonium atrogriseum TaxID=1093897 RepID=A0AAJ0C8P9_9PEZI|nr:uncharacterized protein QBC33DRAFT_173434 [Phialemonium atrogriseum]KAK1772036.1 hypothetical protein QBC33DRAFT_173434 [Phialemonium atrogriseum]